MSNTSKPSPAQEPTAGGMFDRRMLLRGLVGLASGAAIWAHPRQGHQQGATQKRAHGGKPTIALARLPAGPISSGVEGLWIGSLCHDSLLTVNATGSIVAGIALAPAISVDQKELTFSIRRGVIFPDGALLTADDVVASLERIRRLGDSFDQGWRVEHVSEIEAVDDWTIRMELTQPDSSLPGCLSTSAIPILPRDVAASLDAFGLANLPDGSGPFIPGVVPDAETYEFVRNDAFWQIGRPFLNGVTITSIEEDTQRTIALVTEGVDVVIDAPLLDIPSLKLNPNIVLVGGPSVRACVLIPNLDTGGMADRRVRKILSGAINRDALVRNAAGGFGSPEQTIFPKASWPGLDEPPADTDWEQTRKDMREIGHTAGLPLRLIADERDGSTANAAVLIQEQLGYAGFSVTLDLLDDIALARALVTRDYDLFISYTPPWRDPHELVRPLLMSDGSANLSGYRSSRVDHLIRLATLVTGQEDRAAIYHQLQRLLLEEMPVIVLFFPDYYDAMTSRIVDYRAFPPVGADGLRTAWMQPPPPVT